MSHDSHAIAQQLSCDSHLSSTTDTYPIEQFEELVRLGCSDDVISRRAIVGMLLPAPHHQLSQQHSTLQVLREGGREGWRGGEGRSE